MKNIFYALLFFAFGCQQSALYIPPEKEPPGPKKLVIVTPQAWRNAVNPYVDHKSELGFNVQVINVEEAEQTGNMGEWGYNLRKILISAKPDYVFLIGDVAVIPTIYTCSDTSSWTTFTNQACIYSDFLLSVADDQKTVLFPVGRLLARGPNEITNYFNKAINYDSIYGKPSGAYLINDRDYDPNDTAVQEYADILRAAGVPTIVDTLNSKDVPINNGLTEATYKTLESAVNNSSSFIMYIGHGASWGWGYKGNLLWPYFNFAKAKPVPLVYSMSCEAALSAPNTPWYPYYDSTGSYKDFSKRDIDIDGPITIQDMGVMSSLQFHYPYDVVIDNVARHFTSTGEYGAMVYIGETVVTHAEYNFNEQLYTQLVLAYQNGVETVGDIWYNTIKNMLREPAENDVHPIFFQFVGDPSTAFPKAD